MCFNYSGMERIDECVHCCLSNIWRLLEISTSDSSNDDVVIQKNLYINVGIIGV